MQTRKIFAVCLLIVAFTICYQPIFAVSFRIDLQKYNINRAQQFWRTELYFGTDKNDGTEVTGEEWDKFLAETVTPKFPDGFTVLEGYGQFRGSDGKIVRERSKVLILLYPVKTRRTVNRKVEQIRAAYKKAFQQESVLRLDFQSAVRVSF